jgi:hypothetical protein
MHTFMHQSSKIPHHSSLNNNLLLFEIDKILFNVGGSLPMVHVLTFVVGIGFEHKNLALAWCNVGWHFKYYAWIWWMGVFHRTTMQNMRICAM